MSARTGLDVLRGALDGSTPLPPAAALLGWEPLALEPGQVRVRYTARQEFHNPQGNVQGGFLAAMLDDAMGPALYTLLPADGFAPTLELKVSFLRAAKAGTLIAEGRVIHRTRSVAFLEGTLSDGRGELVATASATARIQTNGSNHGIAHGD